MTTEAKQQNSRGATRSAPSRLEKKVSILNSQGTKEIEGRIEQLLTELHLAHNAMNGRKRDLDEARERLAIEEARLLAEAQGSNAEQRKAAAQAARQGDEAYRTQEAACREAQQVYDEGVETFERLKRELGFKSNVLRLRTAQIEFLARDP